MPTTTIAGHEIEVNEEGFLANPDVWSQELGVEFARLIGVEMTDEHWKLVTFLRQDYQEKGETPTLRRTSLQTGLPVKQLFALFPGKPAKKMSYVAGVPKPKGCV